MGESQLLSVPLLSVSLCRPGGWAEARKGLLSADKPAVLWFFLSSAARDVFESPPVGLGGGTLEGGTSPRASPAYCPAEQCARPGVSPKICFRQTRHIFSLKSLNCGVPRYDLPPGRGGKVAQAKLALGQRPTPAQAGLQAPLCCPLLSWNNSKEFQAP